MEALLTTFNERRGALGQAILEHLQISLLALLLAILIAVPLAIAIKERPSARQFVLQMSAVVQTVPSLAILGLLIPLVGIGTVPAIIALVVYALFPILQNTLTGFMEIDPALEEAAEAFGMTRWEKLRKFQLALAMPVLMSGVRTAAVSIIGTATLAALIGSGGLGSFILLGIDRHDTSLILLGAIFSALLAIIFNYVIGWLEHQLLRRIVLSFLALILAVVASYVPVMGQSGPDLVIGGKLGAEPEILINMYEQLLEAETDLEVAVKPNFGKTTFVFEAVQNGDIDIYPEFSGTVINSLLTAPPTDLTNDPRQVYEAAREHILQEYEMAYLEPLAFQNTYALAVRRDFAEAHDLATISDLKALEDDLVAGFTLEFADREDGNKGLQALYGLDMEVATMEPALRYQAIANDEVQVIDAYSTDSQLISYNLVLLEDDRQLFLPYQGAPLLLADILAEYPEIEPVLNQLAGRISEEEMQAMNYAVDVEGRPAREVAREYLQGAGFLE